MRYSLRVCMIFVAVLAILLSLIVVPRIRESQAKAKFGGEGALHAGFSLASPTKLESILGLRGTVESVSLTSRAENLQNLLKSLESFGDLRTVHFRRIVDGHLCSSLTVLPNVKEVSFFGCSEGFVRSFLAKTPGVEIVEFNESDVSDSVFSDLPSASRILELSIRISGIEGTVFHDRRFEKLSALTIDFSPLTQDGVNAIASLVNLESLYVGCESVSHSLDLSRLAECVDLKRVEFSGCEIDGLTVEGIEKRVSRCEIIVDGTRE